MTAQAEKTIGFIGLGAMGFPMAARLAEAGYRLVVSDNDAQRLDAFVVEHSATVSKALSAEDWKPVDVLITMLPTSDIVEAVLLQGRVAASLKTGTMVIDMSSSEPIRTRKLGRQMEELGLRFIDAPVSGGVKRAIEGSLAIMVGGERSVMDAASPILSVIGKSIIHVGPAGAGHAAKALNNYVSAATLVATVEALVTGERFGIDPAVLNDVLNVSSGRSNTSENKVRQFMLSGTFASGFALKLMAKDVRIAMNLADELDAKVPLGKCCLDIWERGAAESDAKTDHTAMYSFLQASSR